MMHEAQTHTHSWFLTLTYDDEHLPHGGTLDPEHPRAFIRSLRDDVKDQWEKHGPRSHYGSPNLSYFLCGEYGDKYLRPHYHIVLFGPDLLDRYRLDHRGDPPVWESGLIADHWEHGLHEFSTVSMGSASYVAGYVRKKVEQQNDPYLYERVFPADHPFAGEVINVQPEYATMSRRPAIGKRWIAKNWRQVYPRDYVVTDGYETKPPRYYDKWMETDHSEQEDNICQDCDEHREVILQVKYNRWDPEYDDSAYKRQARRKIHEARIGLYQTRDAF